MARSMPAQRPGESVQEVGTPPAFLAAVARRFGPIRWDLAANASNSVCGSDAYYGPGSRHGEDSLKERWHMHAGVLFLNPQFDSIQPFAAKCVEEGRLGARVKMLVPAAVSTNWWAEHVHQKAMVLFLRPRLKFVGHAQGFPKDLALVCQLPWAVPGYHTWNWSHPIEAAAP